MTEELATVGGRRLKLTNLDKVLYPAAGFTKREVIEYYRRVAPVLMPHLRGRPLTLKRYPNGVDGEVFYQKQAPKHRPGWVKTVRLPTRDREIDFVVVTGLPTLVWLANLADLELHTSLARATSVDRPTALVFDLDPGTPATVVECCQVALLLRSLGEAAGLEFWPKTSGSKGLQLYAPLNGRVGYDRTKEFAHAVALRLEQEHPDLVVSNIRKEVREGRVLVDWSQNGLMRTTVNVYSLRAREQPTVSTPVTWKEVERAANEGDPTQLVFDWKAALERVDRHGDLFAPVLRVRQRLPRA
ncbi:MAG TPA: non-homologous end-joining DNA ligase [Gaiellales bacterium]